MGTALRDTDKGVQKSWCWRLMVLMACNAAKASRLAGIYFYVLNCG